MKTHSNFASRFFGIIAIGAVGWLQPTAASGQMTPEGTDIDNTATVIYTDANSNTYSSVNSMVRVTVGFTAGVDVVALQGAVSPVSPSSLNTIDFDVQNIGNGTDNVSVTDVITDATVITAITNYRFNLTDYGTRAALNIALAAFPIAAGVTITITVEYTVGADKGGEPSTYTLTATSVRDVGVNNSGNTIVTPALTGTVAVTPDGAQSLTRLPSSVSVPTYTFTFTVQNGQTGSDDFNLVATSPGSAVITIVSVNGDLGASSTVTVAGSGASEPINVVYSVADLLAPDTLYLTATSVANGATNDQGFADMTVIKANLTITKEAWDDVRAVEIITDVFPGDFIEYKVIVSNTGTAPATNVHVDDLLPPQVTWVLNEGDVPADWLIVEDGAGDVDADFTLGPLAPGVTRFFWIRVQVN